jgi:hypothetical protein
VLGFIILADVLSQYLIAIRPFDTGSPGWRLTAVEVAASQLLPVGMAVFLLAVAAYLNPAGSLGGIRLACGLLALLALLMLWFFLTSGAPFALGAQPSFYGRIRIGLLQSVVRSAAAVLQFGVAWWLLGKVIAGRPAARVPA